MQKALQKLDQQIRTKNFSPDLLRIETLATLDYKGEKHPIKSYSVGSQDKTTPVLFLTGGIHGLERIGAQLAWSLLKSTIDRLEWDRSLKDLFKSIRLIVCPLVNPIGYHHLMRSNGQGVDLMRNSPVLAVEKTPFLLGGQTFSSRLPWFQGTKGKLEEENLSLERFFRSQTTGSPCVISLDFHSGFGMKDRIWFPHSFSSKPFDDIGGLYSLVQLFENSHPYHVYQFEPQSKAYLLNGDLWDYFYLEFKKNHGSTVYLPLTLEMGSWNWVRKNPIQIFSRQGPFNPIREHRIKRTFRRHFLFFEFLLKALYSRESWVTSNPEQIKTNQKLGIEKWYE